MSEPTEHDTCTSCGRSRRWHTESIITNGYGERGRCGWFRDPMFSLTGGPGGDPCQRFVKG